MKISQSFYKGWRENGARPGEETGIFLLRTAAAEKSFVPVAVLRLLQAARPGKRCYVVFYTSAPGPKAARAAAVTAASW